MTFLTGCDEVQIFEEITDPNALVALKDTELKDDKWIDDSDRSNMKYYISYEVPSAAAGEYTVRIYHYPEETTILAPVVQDKVETDTEIIIIDG